MKAKPDCDTGLISAELAKLENEAVSEDADVHIEIITSIRENWELLTDSEKRQFLLKFLRRIIIENVKLNEARRSKARIANIEFSE